MKPKILVVDDSIVNRNYLREILEDHNFEVVEAGRGGLETLKGLRAKGFTFPVIIFTSDDKDETRKKCIEAGANDLLYKPSKPATLLKMINNILASQNRL